MKKLISLFCAVLFIAAVIPGSFAATGNVLEFKDGEFKILVLSDTQDDQHPAYDMLNFVKKAIENANPDLILFTGDLVEDSRIGDIGTDDEPFREGVLSKDLFGNVDDEKTIENAVTAARYVLDIFQDSGVPFAIAQGNNDYKCVINNEQWLELYSEYSNNLTLDMSDDAEGRIDYNLEIKGSDGKTAFNIWMMDTGRHGINDDQIEWYKTKSSQYTAGNGGEPIPAMAFQHINTVDIGNLFEECKMTDDGARAVGTKFYRLNREIATGYNFFAYEPGLTSDEFKAWKEQGDVIAAFFGHQHVEGFSGMVDGIELGFTNGCEMAKTGPYGYRVITLHEDDIKNYDNEVWFYEGTVKRGTDRFEKYESEDYPVYKNVVEKFFASIKNGIISAVFLIIDIFR